MEKPLFYKIVKSVLHRSCILVASLLMAVAPLMAQNEDADVQELRNELGLNDEQTEQSSPLPAQPSFQVMDTVFPIGWIPEKTQRLVNDYSGLLTSEQRATLEQRLVAFDDSTSNQVMVLIVPDLGGDEIAAFTQHVWDTWGVGDKKYNNGVIIVVKPKNASRGQVRIQTGYGLEGALPDIFCSKIIRNEMIPHFQQNDYYGGIVAALDVILPVCAGEYNEERYDDSETGGLLALIIFFVIVIVFVLIFSGRHSNFTDSSGMPPYFGSSMGRSSGSWGSFTGGSFGGGSFGGGGFGGGFGGFGGGFSGGGGASGSW